MNALVFFLLFVGAAAAMALVMFAAWKAEQRTGNAGWVDTYWSFGVGAVALAGAMTAWLSQGGPLPLLVGLLVALWSLRLGLHVRARTLATRDDPRYASLRAQWGADAPAQMLKFLQIQAGFGALLAMAPIVAAWRPAPMLGWQDALALLIIACGVAGEAIADAQLRRFRVQPENRGRICDRGLWRLSRHPNYFFEWMVWLAWPLFAISLDGSHSWGWFAALAPACMYWLLNHVSGIPPLEAIMLEKYGAAYRAYQGRTSAFFPLPPAPLAKEPRP